MNTAEVFDHILEAATELEEAWERRKEQSREFGRKAGAAYRAYFDDVDQKKTTVAERVAALQQQIEGIDARIAEHQKKLMRATIAANKEQLDRIQADMANSESEKAAIRTQIGMLKAEPIPGDIELYEAAQNAYQAWAADTKEIREWIFTSKEAVMTKAIRILEEVDESIGKCNPGLGYGIAPKIEKLSEHFRAEAKSPRDPQAEADTPPARNLCIGTYHVGVDRYGR